MCANAIVIFVVFVVTVTRQPLNIETFNDVCKVDEVYMIRSFNGHWHAYVQAYVCAFVFRDIRIIIAHSV